MNSPAYQKEVEDKFKKMCKKLNSGKQVEESESGEETITDYNTAEYYNEAVTIIKYAGALIFL